uniref:Uncharacterized protein n=1 Tax=Tanacetum cinerariifolium TaxID=118510 RepID=A0A699H077_TANCI|nr:hypothetical protein [Tanacetum cinerariifolium]
MFSSKRLMVVESLEMEDDQREVVKALEALVDGDVEELGEFSLDAMDEKDVALVDGVLDGAFVALGDESWCFDEGVLVSSLVRSTNNCLGGMMVILGRGVSAGCVRGLLKGLEVEALVDAMEVMVVDDE